MDFLIFMSTVLAYGLLFWSFMICLETFQNTKDKTQKILHAYVCVFIFVGTILLSLSWLFSK